MKPRHIPFLLFGSYVLLCLLLPEFHPFSRYSMYNRFPNSAYAFYLRNENRDTVALKPNFRMGAQELAHLYGTVVNKLGFDHNTEADSQLTAIGREMLPLILATRRTGLPFHRLELCRVHWYFNGDIIQKDEKQLYSLSLD